MPSAEPTPTTPSRFRWAPQLGLVLGWCVLVAAGWAVGALIVAAGPRFDGGLVASLHASRTGTLTEIMRRITFLGSPVWLDLVFAAALAGLLLRRLWRSALFLVLASPGIVLLEQIVRPAVGRHRPAGLHLTPAKGFSWPSGHAAESTALYGALLLLALRTPVLSHPRARLAAAAFTLLLLMLIGISRVVLGVHYPSDVVAGWLLAAGWLAILSRGLARSPRGHAAIIPAWSRPDR